MENLPAIQTENSIFLDAGRFEFAQRVATGLAKSTIIPEHFQGNVSNVLIALNMANRSGLDPFLVMQNMYVIHGKPGIQAQLIIAMINKSGKYESTGYIYDGTGDTRSCQYVAIAAGTDKKLFGPVISVEMAKRAGWWAKKGSLWPIYTDLMLSYRAASYFAKLNCPEVLFGLDDIQDIQPQTQADSVAIISPAAMVEPKKPLKYTIQEEAPEPEKMQETATENKQQQKPEVQGADYSEMPFERAPNLSDKDELK